MSDVKNIAKKSAMITVVLVISKVLGYIRELIIAAVFGATRESDILRIATTLPNVLFSCVSAALVTTFIPVFSGIKNDQKKANDFFNNILNIIFIICGVLAVIGIITAPTLTWLFARGFKGEDFTRTVQMTRLVMPSIIFLGISGLYTGYLQSYGIFLQPALTGVSADAVIIAGIIIFQKYGIKAAIVATLLSSLAQVLIQMPFMKDYKYRPYINIKDEHIKKMLLLSVPILISTAVSQINIMVDKNFASSLAAGTISVVDNASKLSSIINQVFIVSITTVLYPMLTDRFSKKDMEGFSDLFSKSINIILIVVIPLILGMAVLSTPLVKLLLQHGKFDSNAALATSLCLKILAFSALGYSIMDICGKVFFSAKDTVTPMLNGFIMIGLNILLIIVLVPKMGAQGLAMATATSTCTIAFLLLIELKFKLKILKFKNTAPVFLKTALSGAIMALIVNFSFKYISIAIPSESMLPLIIKIVSVTLLGALSYIAMLYLLKVDELRILLSLKLKR